MSKLLILTFVLLLTGPLLQSQLSRANTPQENQQPHINLLEQKLLDKLAGDKSFRSVACRPAIGEKDEDVQVRKQRIQNEIGEINAAKESAFRVALSGKSINLKMNCSTLEGGRVRYYLTISEGKIYLVIDWTQDRFSRAGVQIFSAEKMELGYFTEPSGGDSKIFNLFDEKAPAGVQLYLRLMPQESYF